MPKPSEPRAIRVDPATLRSKSAQYERQAAETADPETCALLYELSVIFGAMAERVEYRGLLH
jgi:hypothetical protein